jgi:hypothetical protein
MKTCFFCGRNWVVKLKFEALTTVSVLYEGTSGAHWIGSWMSQTAFPDVRASRKIYVKFSW